MSDTTDEIIHSEKDSKSVQIGLRNVDIPLDWEVKSVQNIFDIRKESFDPTEIPSDETVQLYSMPAYDEGREPIETEAREVGSKKYNVPEDTILFPKLNIFLKRFWRIEHQHSHAAICSTEYWPLVPKGDVAVNIDYYYYFFNSDLFMSNPKVSLASGTDSHRRVRQGSFERAKLPVPPLQEQQKIADILTTVDEKMRKTNKLISKNQELKEGLIQDLVLRGLGNEDFKKVLIGPREVQIPSSWSVSSISDVAEIVNGSTPKRDNPEYWEGDIVWVTPTDVTENDGRYISDSEEYITQKGLESSSATILEPGAVLMTSRATIGETVINRVPVTTNQGFKSFVCKDEMHNEYLYYFIQSMVDYLTEIAGGSTFPEISKTDIANIRVPVPPVDEQKKIADIINKPYDKAIEEMELKEKLHQLKRGLMQDLLTGKVRVNTTDE